MKNRIPKRTIDDLLTLIEHARRDISYNEGGTYNDGNNEVDENAVKQSGRAIEFIKTLILTSNI